MRGVHSPTSDPTTVAVVVPDPPAAVRRPRLAAGPRPRLKALKRRAASMELARPLRDKVESLQHWLDLNA